MLRVLFKCFLLIKGKNPTYRGFFSLINKKHLNKTIHITKWTAESLAIKAQNYVFGLHTQDKRLPMSKEPIRIARVIEKYLVLVKKLSFINEKKSENQDKRGNIFGNPFLSVQVENPSI